MISSGLAYVTLAVDDVDAVVSRLVGAFGLRCADGAYGGDTQSRAILPIGQTALVVCGLGDPFVEGHSRPGVHHIALAVDDVLSAAHTAEQAGVKVLTPEPVSSLNGGQRVLLLPEHTRGIRTYLSDSLHVSHGHIAHSGSDILERIDHLGVASDDCDGTVEAFVNRLGFAWEDTETDIETVMAVETFVSKKYGVTQITRPARMIAGVRADFITVGDCELEVIQEIDPENSGQVQHNTAGTTAQDKGAIANYVARRGAGLHHIAFKVPDINSRLAALDAAGLRMIDTVGRPGGRRSQIGFIHPQSMGGVLMHLVEREVR